MFTGLWGSDSIQGKAWHEISLGKGLCQATNNMLGLPTKHVATGLGASFVHKRAPSGR